MHLLSIYNDKRHLLWNRECHQLVRDVMSCMAVIAQALVDRVEAEFCVDDMVCKLHVSNLNEWVSSDMREARKHEMRICFFAL